MNEGLQRALQDLVETGQSWVSAGVITAIDTHAALGFLADVTLSDGTGEVQARLVFPGAGESTGILFPVEVGHEVLVLMPAGDPNLAVAIPGLFSNPAPLPSCFDNTTPQVVHPNGVELRTSETAIVAPVVTEALLSDLADAMQEIATGLAAIPSSATVTNAFVAKLQTLYRTAALKSE